ncbi:hypothetical protein [Compostimonas suwonensis]|uniref:Uncharacterized protein n=1 Tax=Compostimonas suwonensis TaxID=1048394 RepID=A0A2M9BZF7_9MICO|nr:hypothetical protein [Compostimonas suwonensis]PJJ63446.1 hypothetical protein CLV54_1112 [Compostimonas suwonensis]
MTSPRLAATVALIAFGYQVASALVVLVATVGVDALGSSQLPWATATNWLLFALYPSAPIALGVFLSLWRLFPLAGAGGWPGVLLRSAVAVAVGVVVQVLVGLLIRWMTAGSWFSYSAPSLDVDLSDVARLWPELLRNCSSWLPLTAAIALIAWLITTKMARGVNDQQSP